MKQLFRGWADNSLFKKSFRVRVALIWLLIGSIFLFLFFISNIVIIKIVLLFLGLKLVIFNLLRIFNIYILPLPDVYRTKISNINANIITLLYIFFYSHSKAIIIISLVFILIKVINECYKFVKNHFIKAIIKQLFDYFNSSSSSGLDYAFVYVIASPGLSTFYSHRLATNITGTLFRSPLDTKGFLFILSDTVRKYPVDFINWLINRAAATIIINVSDSIEEIDKKTIHEILKLSLGKVILIFYSSKEDIPTIDAKEAGIVTISEKSILSKLPINMLLRNLTTRLIDELLTAYPIAMSDNKLPRDKHSVIEQLSKEGFSPLAGSYLRFRVSESDVERFLCLLDCIEVLIRVSTIVLIINSWRNNSSRLSSENIKKLKIPTLGVWIRILKGIIDVESEDKLVQKISYYWKQPLEYGSYKKLIDDVNGPNLNWGGEIPQSHIGWLDWFVWLRNVTRGHGVVNEKLASPLWHGFHELFLDMVIGLRPLAFASSLVYIEKSKDKQIIRGWDRNKYFVSKNEAEDSIGKVYLKTENREKEKYIMLYPMAIAYKNSILLWNKTREDSLEFIDYSSGKLFNHKVSDTDLYELWKKFEKDEIETEETDISIKCHR